MSATTSLRPRQLARAVGTVMILFVASRLSGLARELIIGARFGTSAELDAYLAAFRLPDILFQLVAGGALASAFLPTFSGYLVRNDSEGADRLASSVINLLLLFLTVLAALAAFLAPWLVRVIIAPGFTPAQQALTATLMRGMLLSTLLFGLSGVVMAMLNARQHFLSPALAPMAYNGAIIGGAWFLAPHWGVRGLVLGVVLGAAGHLAVQLPAVARQRVWRWQPVWGLGDAAVREVFRLMGPRVVGLAAVQANFLINTILASNLPAGSLAALNYAWLLMLLPQGTIAQAIATATFPTFSVLSSRGDYDELRSLLSSTLRVVIFLSLPAAVGLILLRTLLHTVSGHGISANGVAVAGGSVYLAHRDSANLSLFQQIDSNGWLESLAVGSLPFGLGSLADRVFVANYGSNSVTTVDSNTRNVLKTVPVGARPALVATGGGYAWVTSLEGGGVQVIDNSGNLVRTLPTGSKPFGVAYDTEKGWLYVTHWEDHSLWVINAASGRRIHSSVLPGKPFAVTVNPTTGHLFIVLALRQQLLVLDRETLVTVQTLPLPDQGGDDGGQGLAFYGGRVYVTNYGAGSLTIVQDATCQ